MTVSPSRPQDGNRRPSSTIRNARRSVKARNSALPPILFQLPNLGSGSSDDAPDDTENASPTIQEASEEQNAASADRSDLPDSVALSSQDDTEATASSEPRITRIDPPESDVSLLERMGTHAVVFGMLGLMIGGAIYISRNINLPKKQRIVEEQSLDQAIATPMVELASPVHTMPSQTIHSQTIIGPPPGIAPPTEVTFPIQVAMPSHRTDVSSGDIVSLSEPVMGVATPAFPVAQSMPTAQSMPIAQPLPTAQPPEFAAPLPASIALVQPNTQGTPNVSEAELQLAERSKQLAEQIAETEASIQDALPDAPTEPLQSLADIAKEKAAPAPSEKETLLVEPIVKIPSDDKLDQELNAALESMKADAMPTLDTQSVAKVDPVAPNPAVTAAKDIADDVAKATLTAPQEPVLVQEPKIVHRKTNTPAEPNTAIAEILKPGSSLLEDFAYSPLPAKDPAKLSDSSVAAKPASSSEPTRNSYSRTPNAVANWLKYLPPASVNR